MSYKTTYKPNRYNSINYRYINSKTMTKSELSRLKEKFIGESNNNNICGIRNIGNNCYLNSGLQIIASCNELVYELNNSSSIGKFIQLLKDAIRSLLNDRIYDPTDFIDYFSRYNSDFIRGSQCCSQNFIRTLIKNINNDYKYSHFNLIRNNAKYNPEDTFESNEYNKFISSNQIFPESKAQSIFSGITKSYSQGKCKCRKLIEQYSFSFFIDLNLYLDEINYRCSFSEVLKQNIGIENNLIMDCPYCKEEISLKEKTKIIKLPEILIFTLERYQGPFNDVEIIPNETLEMSQYIDKSLKENGTKYELFAINIRLGRSANFGHEICQVKRNGKWYEINDSVGKEISRTGYYNSSYGLFYRKINSNNNIKLFEPKEENVSSCCGSTPLSKNTIYCSNYTNDENNNFLSNKNYLNCGLNIIALFDKLWKELKDLDNKDLPEFIKTLKEFKERLNNNKSNNDNNDLFIRFNEFIEEDSDLNKENKNYTQNFILILLKKINKELLLKPKIKKINISKLYTPDGKERNDYDDFIKNKNINHESKANSIFSFMIKFKNKNKYSFDYFIDLKINLEKFKEDEYDIKEILEEYFSNNVKNKYVSKKIIKLPDILIFTIERNNRSTKIIPNESINMKDYIDDKCIKKENLKFELFAVYLRTERNIEICQVKKDQWYEISAPAPKKTNLTTDYRLINGLFYKRK